jgi:hypothetical protein
MKAYAGRHGIISPVCVISSINLHISNVYVFSNC